MHARDIDQNTFEAIAAQLVQSVRHDGPTQVVRGRHKDYGDTVLIRDASSCMALVDEPGAMVNGVVFARALRAGWRTDMRADAVMTGTIVGGVQDFGFDNPEREVRKAKLVVKLGSLIETRGLTVNAAAAELSVGPEHLGLILRGRRDAPIERLKTFVRVLEGH